MAWKTINDMCYDEEEDNTVRGVNLDGSINTRHGRNNNKFCELY